MVFPRVDVFGLDHINVGPLSRNVGPERPFVLQLICSGNPAVFAFLGPLHLARHPRCRLPRFGNHDLVGGLPSDHHTAIKEGKTQEREFNAYTKCLHFPTPPLHPSLPRFAVEIDVCRGAH